MGNPCIIWFFVPFIIKQKTEIFLDGKVGDLVQSNLVRLMLYRLTSVDSGLRAPALNFFISGRLAEILLRKAQSCGRELCT
ncbi:MAG: hypothetical protein A2Z38_07725 [Planctomycetes bacterium RBG_19FT_COMBO_48_8]|nr:MAG: hypothetical protein A2Z38_07725 [Planctomycetes bacterium RBG_19FT_COMBO_48_8]